MLTVKIPDRDPDRTSPEGADIYDLGLFDADRYQFDFGLPAGWKQYDTDQDASYHGIWVNTDRQLVLTYCEGDLTLVHARTPDVFRAYLGSMESFYGAPPPAFTAIGDDGSITRYYDPRPPCQE